jgi:hypothetical protein
MRRLLAALVLAALCGPVQAQTPAQAPAGTTIETAIVLPGIADEFHGVVAEHAYIAAHFPAWHIEYQARIAHDDGEYDVIGMVTPERAQVPVFFDVTPWLGK